MNRRQQSKQRGKELEQESPGWKMATRISRIDTNSSNAECGMRNAEAWPREHATGAKSSSAPLRLVSQLSTINSQPVGNHGWTRIRIPNNPAWARFDIVCERHPEVRSARQRQRTGALQDARATPGAVRGATASRTAAVLRRFPLPEQVHTIQ